jgi:hypothetical protein
MLYLLLLIPLAVVGIWTKRQGEQCHRGGVLPRVLRVLRRGRARDRLREVDERRVELLLERVGGLCGGIAAAVCLAASQTPPLPLVEIKADRNSTLACSKVPTKNMFVMLDRSDSFLYLYNKEGLLSLPEGKADTVRFRECQGYLDRD